MKEAEIRYIQVKDHQDEIQVLLLLRRNTHTHPARRAGCSRQLFCDHQCKIHSVVDDPRVKEYRRIPALH